MVFGSNLLILLGKKKITVKCKYIYFSDLLTTNINAQSIETILAYRTGW